MTLKIHQLVALVAIAVVGLVLLLQAAMMLFMQHRLEQQLTEQSGKLSQLVLQRAAEHLTVPAPPAAPATAVIHPIPAPPAAPTAPSAPERPSTVQPQASPVQAYTFVTRRSDSKVTIESAGDKTPAGSPAPVVVFSPTTEQQLLVVHRGDANAPDLPKVLNEQLQVTLKELRQPGSAQWVQEYKIQRSSGSQALLQEYFRSLLLTLVLSAGLLLLLILLFSRKLLAPLQSLVTGFQQLAAGHVGVQLPAEQGLAEYRFLLSQFNQASQQLADWQARHDELAKQQQLIELGEVSRGLVHALRNPLHTINLALEQLQQDPTSVEQLQRVLEAKIQHINRTLTALLTLSCQQLDRAQWLPLDAVLNDLALEFSEHAIDWPTATGLELAGAESEIRTMLHVLVANAVEASPAPGTIQVSYQREADSMCIQVKDQGPGLASAVRERLFEPHVSSKPEGAGMGLYLCQRLAQLYYQGDVMLAECSTGGCVARLTLPAHHWRTLQEGSDVPR